MTNDLFSITTMARLPQQHMKITMGPYYQTQSLNFPCGIKVNKDMVWKLD